LTDADSRKIKPSLFASLPQRWWRLCLARTEEKRFRPDGLLVKFFVQFKNKMKN
jgi:hypothetical protein